MAIETPNPLGTRMTNFQLAELGVAAIGVAAISHKRWIIALICIFSLCSVQP